ncbi:hypothetical protein CRG98_007912 [Punica granatum]|uniref:AT-hook motif nuclear-localized protein n=1 Tax=Punica granatum TaxID=22663 RepID=A0A2I0KTN0_PUNGR|nr:hypothetical protein CRG98_007912 [Punica granatum]
MSGSEAGGVMASSRGGEPFTQNMRLTFSADGAALYKPVAVSGAASPPYQAPSATGNGGSAEGPASGGPPLFAHGLNMNMSSGEPVKRKRGRPRKYGPDGTMSLTLTPGTKGSSAPQSAGFPSPAAAVAVPTGGSVSPNSMKKSRGRPPGLGRKKQLEALGSVGIGFTPHVITVKAGEGRYEILSLSGSFMLSESGGHRSRTGGLSVSLSGADGRVLGGGVAGLLTAASPVQVVVGSFMSDSRKESKSPKQADPFSGTTMLGHSGGFAGGSSPSHGTLSESSGGPGSPLNQSSGPCNNSNPQRLESMPWK